MCSAYIILLHIQVALTDEQLQKMADLSGELIAVEGTKLKISRKVCNQKEKLRKQALTYAFFFSKFGIGTV